MPSLPSTQRRVPSGHGTESSILYLHSPTVRPKYIVWLSEDPLIQDSLTRTHPDSSDLSHIKQQPQETVHHFWARFLLVMSKVKDCRKEDAISFFCKNCMDKGILNAISHRNISHFADLAAIVQKYCAMESTWKTQKILGSSGSH